MGWYILQCGAGRERAALKSCRRYLSFAALQTAFSFHCQRLWRSGGLWRLVEREMFPGYIFLESDCPALLSQELKQRREVLRVTGEPGDLISVYEEEARYLQELCGPGHCMYLSYGYREKGVDYITQGPLKGRENRILRLDWHRRFVQVEIPVSGRNVIIWAGLGLDENAALDSGKRENMLVS